jgi:hypothetical protein
MKRKVLTYTYRALMLIAFFALLGWAGRSDYEDAVITEMKNNGSYNELSTQHPEASDSELVNIYEKLKNENK